jgi:hypothetical protein
LISTLATEYNGESMGRMEEAVSGGRGGRRQNGLSDSWHEATAERCQSPMQAPFRAPLETATEYNGESMGRKEMGRMEEAVPGGRGGRRRDGLSDSWCEATTGRRQLLMQALFRTPLETACGISAQLCGPRVGLSLFNVFGEALSWRQP